MNFQIDSGATADLGSFLIEGRLVGPRALVTLFQDPRNLILEILRPKLGVLRLRRGYIGYMVHWKRDYTRMPRSLVVPTRGARGYNKLTD